MDRVRNQPFLEPSCQPPARDNGRGAKQCHRYRHHPRRRRRRHRRRREFLTPKSLLINDEASEIMGLCLCKDKKTSSSVADDDGLRSEDGGSVGQHRRQPPDSGTLPLTIDNFGLQDEVLFARPSHFGVGVGVGRSSCNHHFIVTRSTIDRLVLETLAVIRTLVDK